MKPRDINFTPNPTIRVAETLALLGEATNPELMGIADVSRTHTHEILQLLNTEGLVVPTVDDSPENSPAYSGAKAKNWSLTPEGEQRVLEEAVDRRDELNRIIGALSTRSPHLEIDQEIPAFSMDEDKMPISHQQFINRVLALLVKKYTDEDDDFYIHDFYDSIAPNAYTAKALKVLMPQTELITVPKGHHTDEKRPGISVIDARITAPFAKELVERFRNSNRGRAARSNVIQFGRRTA